MKREIISISILVFLLMGSTLPSLSDDIEGGDINSENDEISDGYTVEAGATVAGVKTLKTVYDVTIQGQDYAVSRKYSVIHGSKIFSGYTWDNGTNIQVSLIASFDDGKTWTTAVDVWSGSSSSYSAARLNLYIWKERLYVFINSVSSNNNRKHLYYRNASIESWANVGASTLESIPVNYAIENSIDSDDTNMYLVVKANHILQGYYLKFDGVSWSTPKTVVPTGHCGDIHITVDSSGSSTDLMIFYNRAYQTGSLATGYTYMISSANQGTSWSSPRIVMNDRNDYNHLDTAAWNGTTVLFSNHYYIDDIDMVISRDGGSTWSNEITLVQSRGLPSYGSWKMSFAIGQSNAGNIRLVYENSDNDIKMIQSKDWGSNWVDESDALILDSGPSINPYISEFGELLNILHYNSNQYDLKVIDLRFIDEFTPKNLTADSGYLYVNLTWEPPSNEIFDNFLFDNYTVFRGADPSSMSPYKVMGNVTWFRDTFDYSNGGTYFYGVVSNFEIGGTSSMSNIVMAEPLIPPPVEDLSADPGDFSVDLTWTGVLSGVTDLYPVDSYNVYRGLYPDALMLFDTVLSGTQYHDDDIDEIPSKYYYRISYNLSGIGEGLLSEMVSTEPYTTPMKPLGLNLVESTDGLILNWMPPSDDGGYPILDYNVFFGNSPLMMDMIHTAAPSDRTADIENLTLGLTYFVNVAANNRLGSGEFSDILSFTYRSIPSRPEDFQLVGGDEEIKIMWSSPAITWDLPVLGYRLYRGDDPDSMFIHIEFGPDDFSFIDPVKNGREYHYAVSCYNVLGEGPQAGPLHAHASGLPGEVLNLTISAGDSSTHLRWTGVADDGGTPITGYRLYRNVFDFDILYLEDIPAGGDRFDDLGLENGLTQYYWISALNKNGEGPLIGPVSMIPGCRPFPISTLIGIGRMNEVLLRWEVPDDGGAEITYYNIYRGNQGYSLALYQRLAAESLSNLSYTDEDLKRGDGFFYSITSENSWGESNLSTIIGVDPLSLPTPPSIISATNSRDTIHLKWAPPDDDGGIVVKDYSVYYTIKGLFDEFSEIVDGRFVSIRGFSQGDVVNAWVTAHNELGEGAPSEIRTIDVGYIPDPPASFTVEPRDGSLMIYWSFDTEAVEYIDIVNLYIEDEDHGMNRILDVDPSSGSFLVRGLENGMKYTVWIKAENGWGEGASSNRMSVTPVSIPGQVTDIWVEELMDSRVVIGWIPPNNIGGSDIDMANIYRGESENTLILVGTVTDGTFYEDLAVNNGIEYFYSVQVANGIGEGPSSGIISVTPMGPPGAPIDLSGSAATDEVKLSFQPPITDGGSDILGYIIYKGKDPDDLHVWKYLDIGTFKTTDMDVKSGGYHYRVEAYNAHGVGESAEINVEVPSRNGLAVFFGISSFLIPIILGVIIVVIAALIRRKSGSDTETPPDTAESSPKKVSTIDLPYGPTGYPELGSPNPPSSNEGISRPQLPEAPVPVSRDSIQNDHPNYSRASGSAHDYHTDMLKRNETVMIGVSPMPDETQSATPPSMTPEPESVEPDVHPQGEQPPPLMIDDEIKELEFSKPPEMEENVR